MKTATQPLQRPHALIGHAAPCGCAVVVRIIEPGDDADTARRHLKAAGLRPHAVPLEHAEPTECRHALSARNRTRTALFYR